MTFEDYRINHFRKLHNNIIGICWLGAFIIFLLEVVIFFANYKLGFIDELAKYILIRILMPTLINFGTCIYGTVVIYGNKGTENFRNYVSSFSVLVCCTVVACVHCYYSFLLFSLMIPVFLSIIFCSRKLVKVISIVTAFCTVLASVVYFFEYISELMVHRMMSLFCLWALFAACVVIANILVLFQEKQINFISETCKQQQDLIEELKIEPMTGLYNKTCFEACLGAYQRKFEAGLFNPTCCIIDIDHFKKVNDTYGHIEGDKVLRNMALIIKTNMGSIRRAFRFGGEEFVILWENEPVEEVLAKVMAIKKDFCDFRYDFAPDKSFSFSAGICVMKKGMTGENWFKYADETLYKAKQDGRDRIYVYPVKD